MYVHYMHARACRVERGMSDTLELELQGVVSLPTWVLGTKPGPLQKQ